MKKYYIVLLTLLPASIYGQSCLGNSDFSIIVTGHCSAWDLARKLGHKLDQLAPNCPHGKVEELRKLLGDLQDLQAAEERIDDICGVALAEYQSVDFGSITGRGSGFDEEFFNGGTFLNLERETIVNGQHTQVLQNDGEFIHDFYHDKSENHHVTFPDNLPNFINCAVNSALCCWVGDRQANDGNGNCEEPYDTNCVNSVPDANTDLCLNGNTPRNVVETYRDVHCHGFAWGPEPSDRSNVFKGNNLFYVSMYDHLYERGYVKNVPGYPMCGCLEKMPKVTRSDCTEIGYWGRFQFNYSAASKSFDIDTKEAWVYFDACDGVHDHNDLEQYYARLLLEGRATDANYEAVRKVLDHECATLSRKENGSDDYYEFADDDYQGDDNTDDVLADPVPGNCNNVPGWMDSWGDGCEWYEANDPKCDQGECCENNGHTPNTACCVCGGGLSGSTPLPPPPPPLPITPSPTTSTPAPVQSSNTASPSEAQTVVVPAPSPTCIDKVWKDSWGDTCDWYKENYKFCEAEGFGNDGETASTACCFCGGGNVQSGGGDSLGPLDPVVLLPNMG
jgi:hypothetical protein